MESTHRKFWWVFLLQGVITVLFGLAALSWPGLTLFSFILLFGVFAVVVGISRIATSLTNRDESGWWLALISGIAGIVAGILAFVWPGLTALVLLLVIGAHALIAGVAAVWRTLISWSMAEGRWLTLLGGIAAIIFGILVFVWPGATVLTLTWLIGIYALVFGASEIVLSVVVKRTEDQTQSSQGNSTTAHGESEAKLS